MSSETVKALVGWKRASVMQGTMVTMQLVTSREALHERNFEITRIVVDDRQLASLVRDLSRAARLRGIAL
jgi:hypothetical protein